MAAVGPGDHPVPWAMQIAVLVDKAHSASHIATCEVAARAVVSLLDDPRAVEGPWHEAVQHWRDGRIRKLVRRARGARWTEVQELPGVSVTQGLAAARAFVPGPVEPLARPLAKLQVEGTDLPDDEDSAAGDALVRIGISPLVAMTTGKSAAQCGHAAQLAAEAMDAPTLERWRADGFRVRVERVAPDVWARDRGRIQVIDAGFTELDGPTETARAWW